MPKFENGMYTCDCVRNYGRHCSCTTAALTPIYGGPITVTSSGLSTWTTLPVDPLNEYRIIEDAEILKLCDTLDLVGVMDNIDLLFKIKARFFLEMGFVRWIGIELPETNERIRFNVDRLIAITNPTPQPLEKQVLFG